MSARIQYKTIKGVSVWVDAHAEWPCEKCAKPTTYRCHVFDRMAAWCGCGNGASVRASATNQQHTKNPAAVALGKMRSPAKAKASRANGKLGGRPRLRKK